MYSLLVLGLIPGTNIQISFQVWLGLAVLLLAALYRLNVELNHSPERRLARNYIHYRVRVDVLVNLLWRQITITSLRVYARILVPTSLKASKQQYEELQQLAARRLA